MPTCVPPCYFRSLASPGWGSNPGYCYDVTLCATRKQTNTALIDLIRSYTPGVCAVWETSWMVLAFRRCTVRRTALLEVSTGLLNVALCHRCMTFSEFKSRGRLSSCTLLHMEVTVCLNWLWLTCEIFTFYINGGKQSAVVGSIQLSQYSVWWEMLNRCTGT